MGVRLAQAHSGMQPLACWDGWSHQLFLTATAVHLGALIIYLPVI